MNPSDAVQGGLVWRKSLASAQGDCVEVACAADVIHVRNSKAPAEAVLRFTRSEWTAFLVGVRRGEFDLSVEGFQQRR